MKKEVEHLLLRPVHTGTEPAHSQDFMKKEVVTSRHDASPRPGHLGLRPLPKAWRRMRRTETWAAHKHASALKGTLPSPSKKHPTLPPKGQAGTASTKPRSRLPMGDRLTFTWLGSPGLLPSGGFVALLSTRGRTTCRKGLHSGKPLTLIPSGRKVRRKGVRRVAGFFNVGELFKTTETGKSLQRLAPVGSRAARPTWYTCSVKVQSLLP